MLQHKQYKNILCVRADNMGDVIMSSVAMRALKQQFDCRITLLTSQAGAAVCRYIDCIDDVIVADLPWVKADRLKEEDLTQIAAEIGKRHFDAAVIFTVYSQSALPAAMLLYMAKVPVRVAYSRENPYGLLSHWVADHEPYEYIAHQVERDLKLVKELGVTTESDKLSLRIYPEDDRQFYEKLNRLIPDIESEDYIVLHPGVSEAKRSYPAELWIGVGQQLVQKYGFPLFISGSDDERSLTEKIATGIGAGAISVAGLLTLGEFMCLIDHAHCIVSVNTSTIHIAAARQTPSVVLYAQTNPQHTPWKSPCEVLYFSVPVPLRSNNTVIQYVAKRMYSEPITYPEPTLVVGAVSKLISNPSE
jgi:ADP-heptose:LPS heptosyltransferase